MMFWVLSAAAAGLAAWWVVRPLIKTAGAEEASAATARAASYREAMAGLEADRLARAIPLEEADAERVALARALLAEAQAAAAGTAQASPPRRWAALALIALLPLASLALYLAVGTPALLGDSEAARGIAETRALMALVAEVEARLAERPGDSEGQLVLARGLAALGRFGEAAAAYRRAIALGEDEASVHAALGEVLAFAGEAFGPDAMTAFAAALARDPDHPKALLLQAEGFAANGDLAAAIANWERLAARAAPGSPAADALRQRIADARGQGAPPLDEEALARIEALPAGERDAAIRAMVEGLASRLSDAPDDLPGWQRLIRSYRVLGEEAKAAEALATARAHFAGNAEALSRLNTLSTEPSSLTGPAPTP